MTSLLSYFFPSSSSDETPENNHETTKTTTSPQQQKSNHQDASSSIAAKKGTATSQKSASQSQSQSNTITPTPTTNTTEKNTHPTFTLSQIEEHDSDDDCWIVVHGKVYDVSEFAWEHPGGADIILQFAGGNEMEECNISFDLADHSEFALEQMEQYYIGNYKEEEEADE